MQLFLVRVLVGIPVSYFALCFIVGGVQNATGFLLMSIVCTAGIGLVAWIPLWWFVGSLTLGLGQIGFDLSRDKNKRRVGPAPFVDRNRKALITYFRQAKAQGVSDDTLTDRLQSMGWSTAEILQARQNENSSNQK